jgi:hypothetical protein
MSRVILDPGPIPLAEIERFDDPDVETALDHDGVDPNAASFRLVEIAVADLQDFGWLQRRPKERSTTYVLEAVRRGTLLPPIVVKPTAVDGVYGLLDGLNRAHAHWLLDRATIRAYELVRKG